MLQKSSCSSKYQVNPSLHLLFAGSFNHPGYAFDRKNFLEFLKTDSCNLCGSAEGYFLGFIHLHDSINPARRKHFREQISFLFMHFDELPCYILCDYDNQFCAFSVRSSSVNSVPLWLYFVVLCGCFRMKTRQLKGPGP